MLIETIPMRVPKERSPDYVEAKDMDARTMEVFEEGQMDEAAYQRRAEAEMAGRPLLPVSAGPDGETDT